MFRVFGDIWGSLIIGIISKNLRPKKQPTIRFSFVTGEYCCRREDWYVIKDWWVTFPDDPSNCELAYEGPSFRVLDEKLRKAFHWKIEIRWIKPSMINFLHEYMINKNSKQHLLGLKTFKNFVKF